jgi:hypothetical protein
MNRAEKKLKRYRDRKAKKLTRKPERANSSKWTCHKCHSIGGSMKPNIVPSLDSDDYELYCNTCYSTLRESGRKRVDFCTECGKEYDYDKLTMVIHGCDGKEEELLFCPDCKGGISLGADFYEEVAVTDKLNYFNNNSPIDKDFDGTVNCMHCGNAFVVSEFKVVRDKRNGNEFIVCKHFPKCNGTVMDFVSSDVYSSF